MFRRALFAAALAAVFASPIAAQECADETFADLLARLQSRFPAVTAERLNAEETAALVAAYNAIPPATTYVADQVYVLRTPVAPGPLVVLVQGACVVVAEPRISDELLVRFRRGGA